ncbi:MAG: ribonuclease H-like domain-containing protein [Mycobacterium leprae]
MDLRERLRLLKVVATERAAQESRPASPPPVSQPASAPSAPTGSDRRLALAGGCLQGFVTDTGCGEVFFLEQRYPLSHERGPLSLAHLFHVPGDAWELLGRVPATSDLRRAVFFDTETTGLAGGTGTYAFLVGLGFFAGEEFVLRQYFLRDYPEEEAMLELLTADFAGCDLLVTFNGKSFDWPLMETRFRMARRRVPLAGTPHLDLLHPSRRVFKARLGQCNLTRLEEYVLGVTRTGDVPSALIPQLYFDYLRSGDATALVDVIEHNRLDILSLVSLATWLGRIVTDPLSPTPDGELVPGDDLYALGRLLEARGRPADAIDCYTAAAERGTESVHTSLLLRELALAHKRAGQYGQALALWEELTAEPGSHSYHALVEMAKYYEHVARDYALAHTAATRAKEQAERRLSLAAHYGPGAREDWEAIQHRLARLERKQVP